MRLPSALLLLALLSSAPALAQDAKPVWPPCGERPTFEKAFEEATLVLVGRVLQSKGYQQRLVTGHSRQDRKSTRLNSSHSQISYAVFCLKKKKHADSVGRLHSSHSKSRGPAMRVRFGACC